MVTILISVLLIAGGAIGVWVGISLLQKKQERLVLDPSVTIVFEQSVGEGRIFPSAVNVLLYFLGRGLISDPVLIEEITSTLPLNSDEKEEEEEGQAAVFKQSLFVVKGVRKQHIGGPNIVVPADVAEALLVDIHTCDAITLLIDRAFGGLWDESSEGLKAKIVSMFPAPPADLPPFMSDLTAFAREGSLHNIEPMDDIAVRIETALNKLTHRFAIIHGPPGVGKTTVLEYVAQRIVEGKSGFREKDIQLLHVDWSQLKAGADEQELTLRVDFVLEFLRRGVIEAQNSIIIAIDEIADALLDARFGAAILRGISSGEFAIVGTLTTDKLSKINNAIDDRAVLDRMTIIEVPKPTKTEALKKVSSRARELEEKRNVEISGEDIALAIDLAVKHIVDTVLPRSAIKILESAVSYAEGAGLGVIDADCVIAGAAVETHTPEDRLRNSVGLPTGEVLDFAAKKAILDARIIGQDGAKAAALKIIAIWRAGLSAKDKPFAFYIFAGLPGVGKTELALALAEMTGAAFLRLDMSEYSKEHEVSRLVGAPPGYEGYGKGEGQIIKFLLNNRGMSIILMDEIEKAHVAVWDYLLQVLEGGRLTAGSGETVSFERTILIMTTNLGSAQMVEIVRQSGAISEKDARSIVLSQIRSKLRPEIYSRIMGMGDDVIVVFNMLTQAQAARIVKLHLSRKLDGWREMGWILEPNDRFVSAIAQVGCLQLEFGARPLVGILASIERMLAVFYSAGALPKHSRVRLFAEETTENTGGFNFVARPAGSRSEPILIGHI